MVFDILIGIRKGRMPLARGLGCPQNLFYFKQYSQSNIDCRAARATARVAPTGLHCLNVYRAVIILKQAYYGRRFRSGAM